MTTAKYAFNTAFQTARKILWQFTQKPRDVCGFHDGDVELAAKEIIAMTPYANDESFSDEPFPLPLRVFPCGFCGKPIEGTHSQIDGKAYHLHCVGYVDRQGESVIFEDMDPRPFTAPVCRNCGKALDLCAACNAAMGS